jgi:hypothetical protein
MDVGKINLSSGLAFGFVVPLIAGAWGIYMFVSPKFNMISTNQLQIKSNKENVEKVDNKIEKAKEKYNEHMIIITGALSDIKAQLKIMHEDRNQKLRSGK